MTREYAALPFSAALVSDLHLTDHARDAYRWELFPWLLNLLRKPPFPIHFLCLLGDTTDAKDYHSSRLVNRVVDAISNLIIGAGLKRVYILRGNHDGIDPDCPYFRFLGHLPLVHYVSTIWHEPLGDTEVLMLPHTRKPQEDWQHAEFTDANVVLMHATVQGAKAESGVELDGVHQGFFTGCRGQIYSGDVHVPQKVGKVTYVGAPYPVHFGDRFEGGVTLLSNGKFHSAPRFPTLRRWSLKLRSPLELGALEAEIQAKDQCKVFLELERSEYGSWMTYKKQITEWAEGKGVDLVGLELVAKTEKPTSTRPRIHSRAQRLSHAQILTEYCGRKKIQDDLQTTGQTFLQRALQEGQ